jgi:hypothetical protein
MFELQHVQRYWARALCNGPAAAQLGVMSPVPTRLHSVLQVQREYLDTQIRGLSNSHVVQPGVKRQKVPLLPAHARIKEVAVPVKVSAGVPVCLPSAMLLAVHFGLAVAVWAP